MGPLHICGTDNSHEGDSYLPSDSGSPTHSAEVVLLGRQSLTVNKHRWYIAPGRPNHAEAERPTPYTPKLHTWLKIVLGWAPDGAAFRGLQD